MNVLIDIHHEELFESLRILFEDRLGMRVFRPVGIEWWKEGYWQLAPHLDQQKQESAANQFLDISENIRYRELKPGERLAGDCLIVEELDGRKYLRYLNLFGGYFADGTYELRSPVYTHQVYRGVSLKQFKSMDFDILIATVPEHIDPYKELIELYQPRAKLIFQAGNPWPPPENVENILTSTRQALTDKVNCVFYHQQFSLDLYSLPLPNRVEKKSMFNLQHFMDFPDEFAALERTLGPEWSCLALGAGNRDGVPPPDNWGIRNLFRTQGFCYHNKKLGDGYGYNIHHAAATGTPLVLDTSYFKGQTAAPLLVDGVTCIDMNERSIDEVAEVMADAAANYEDWSLRCRAHFDKVVDFDQEFLEIQRFIDRLQ